MAEEVPQRHRAPVLAGHRAVEEFGQQGVERLIEREHPALDQKENGGRGDRLGDRRQPPDRRRVDRAPGGAIGQPEVRFPGDPPAARGERRHAGEGAIGRPSFEQREGAAQGIGREPGVARGIEHSVIIGRGGHQYSSSG